MQAPLTFCQTLCVHLHPSLGPRAVLPWVCKLISQFCTPAVPQGSLFPHGPAKPLVMEGRAVTPPRDISAQHGCNTSSGEQRAFCFQRGVLVLVPKSIPVPCSPGLCPAALGSAGGAVGLLAAASWGHCRSPFLGPRLPKPLEPSSF